jgi:hypothetical protein
MNEEEMRAAIGAIREETGNLIHNIMWPLKDFIGITLINHEDEAERRGKAVARFYKELIAAGIDPAAAIQLTQTEFINPTEIIRDYVVKDLEVARDILMAIASSQVPKKTE